MHHVIESLVVVAALTGGSFLLAGEPASWPQWRGPNRDGLSSETGLMRRWSSPPKLVWKTSGLGIGYSTVALAQNRGFTTGKHDGDEFVFAFDVSNGRDLWNTKIGETERTPCSTPTIDGERVFAVSPDGDLCCLDVASGNLLWRKHFVDDFQGRMQSGRGYGESVLIDGASLVCTPGGRDATIVKLDKLTGEVVWKCAVPHIGKRGSDGASFSSIVMTSAAGIRQYIQLIGRGLVGVSADDGRFLWGYDRIANDIANIPTAVVRGDLVFAANGYNAGSALLKLTSDGKGEVHVEEIYFLTGSQFQNHHGGFVLVGDCVYGGHGSNNGLPACIEFETGKILWKRRGPGSGSAAVVCADGHLYFRYQNGLMALIEVNRERYKLKGTFQLSGAGTDSWPHPVVAGGKLYLREKNDLRVYDVTAK